jgi:signal peptidase I
VSKLAYGPRVPETPLTIPFTHNVIFGKESYSTLIHNKYRRLKGFGQVKRGDAVVFGFPNGDTVLKKAPVEDYHALVRANGRELVESRLGPIIVRPTDKKDHYVKRCVALPGDTLTVKEGLVYINSVQQEVYPGIQLSYRVVTNGQRINSKVLEKLGLNIGELYYDPSLPGYPEMPLTAAMLEKVKDMPGVVSAEPNIETYPSADAYGIFPFSPDYRWTRDWFGPLWIPKKGETVELDTDNLPLYERIITAYEKNDLKVSEEGIIYINGKEAYSYTFAQDYYFMMGDNRHNSLDSRYWGFVPEDHIVGKPSVIWLSTNRDAKFPKNIRWRRFLKFV